MVTQKIPISDMQCNGCAGRARTALMGVKGVVKVISSLDDHNAEVTYDEQLVSIDDLNSALASAGFERPENKDQ